MSNYDMVNEQLAKTGYEEMFDERWVDLPPKSIERALWKKIAKRMIARLWELYKWREVR